MKTITQARKPRYLSQLKKAAAAQRAAASPLCVLIVAAECAPFAKTGGLADVVGALPRYLAECGCDARVILPFHHVIKDKLASEVEHLCCFSIDLGWRSQYVGVEKYLADGITYYFIDNEAYFGDQIYRGGKAEGEQYAYFTRAVLTALPLLDFSPSLLHVNDWHAAMLPMLIKTQYAGHQQSAPKTLLTIHNIFYQGRFPFPFVRDLLSVDARYYTPEFMENFGAASFLKGGCVFADQLNTVSPSYAEEIQSEPAGEGLSGILCARSSQLSGILNGIDTRLFDPASDSLLAQPYSAADWSGKAANKKALCAELGLQEAENTPLIAMVTRMTAQKGFDLVVQTLDQLMQADIRFVLLGSGDSHYEAFMRAAEQRYKGKLCAYIGYHEALAHRIYAGADLLLMPSQFEPCGLSQMIAMRYGTLPVVRETGGLKDSVQPYNQYTGAGSGFSFTNFEAEEMLETLGRSIYLFRYDQPAFNRLVGQAMREDFSFSRCAAAYAALYQQTLSC